MDGHAHLIRRSRWTTTAPRRRGFGGSPLRAYVLVAVLLSALVAGLGAADATAAGKGQGAHRHRPEALRPAVLPLPDGASEPRLVRLAENGDVLAGVTLGGTVHAVVWRGGRPTDLGDAFPIDLEAGRAVGVVGEGDGIAYWADLDRPAATLPLPSATVHAKAVDLGPSGTVAGLTQDADGRLSAVVWPRGGRPVTILGVPAGGTVQVTRVTDDDAVYGDIQDPGGPCLVWRWDVVNGVRHVLRRPAKPERGYLAGPLAAVSAQGHWLVTGAGGDPVTTVWSLGQGIRAVVGAGSLGVRSGVATAVTDQGVVAGSMQEWTTDYPRGWRWDHRFGLVGEPWSGPVSDMNSLGDVVSALRWPPTVRVTHGAAVYALEYLGEVPTAPQINDVGEVASTMTVVDDEDRPLRTELVVWS